MVFWEKQKNALQNRSGRVHRQVYLRLAKTKLSGDGSAR